MQNSDIVGLRIITGVRQSANAFAQKVDHVMFVVLHFSKYSIDLPNLYISHDAVTVVPGRPVCKPSHRIVVTISTPAMGICPLIRFATPMKANVEERNERRRLVEKTEAHVVV